MALPDATKERITLGRKLKAAMTRPPIRINLPAKNNKGNPQQQLSATKLDLLAELPLPEAEERLLLKCAEGWWVLEKAELEVIAGVKATEFIKKPFKALI